jgi:hypothetical protein
MKRRISRAALILAVAGVAASSACRQGDASNGATGSPALAAPALVPQAQRDAALRAARVWEPPPVPIAQAKTGSNPPGPGVLAEDAVIECRLVVKGMSGTTPKFDCERSGTDVVRVKYGRGNPELHAEIAATRLLAAIGFGADRMYTVKTVRCAGCPAFPFHALKCLAGTGLQQACFAGGPDYTSSTDFDYVSIERRLEGRRIETARDQGWSFYEIDRIDERAGGSPRAHVDALKLVAVFLSHWDNKAENQRLLCLPGGDRPDGSCSRPLAFLQDLGASFGPAKLDLHNWRARPIWADARTCLVTMKDLPWQGATFPEQRISEAGRQFLLSLLEQLTPRQVHELFAGARVELSEGVTAENRQPSAWAAAFQDKVRQIRDAGPCP